ncbi:MAG TPA: hypothetical protein VFW69_25150 [Mycobacterium sp.]|nr:hypothetical protein [Mycobacterium sp.]
MRPVRFDLGTRLFPQTPPSGWRDNADLLVPDFFYPSTDQWHIAIQSCAFDVDAPAAAVTRQRIFAEAVQAKAAMIPAHYPGRGGATIRADRFDVGQWLDIESL